jgi:hypothetical protein
MASNLPPGPPPPEPATDWQDTAMRQEFDVIQEQFNKWVRDFEIDAPSEDFKALCRIADAVLTEFDNYMTGRCD